MANPFPGMDPYLEGDLWPSVHANLATEITRQLNPLLQPKYVAVTTQRVVLAMPDNMDGARTRWPEVGVVVREPPPANGGTAVATAPLIANALAAVPVPHYGIEIRHPVDHRLVTAIEILSPTNKRGDGRDEYAVKRQELLAGPVHLVEIDLLRTGDRFPVDRTLPSVPYFVFVSRAKLRPQVAIWPIPLAAPLPVVRVPLDPWEPDVPLDLQTVLDCLHQEMRYDELVDYTQQSPAPPVSDEDAAWIDAQLRRWQAQLTAQSSSDNWPAEVRLPAGEAAPRAARPAAM